MKKEHVEVSELLAIYQDLDDRVRQEVDQHVQRCPMCASSLSDYRAMDRDLRRLDDLAPGERLRQEFYSAIGLRESPVNSVGAPGRWLPLAGQVLELALAALLIAGAGLILRGWLRSPVPSLIPPAVELVLSEERVDSQNQSLTQPAASISHAIDQKTVIAPQEPPSTAISAGFSPVDSLPGVFTSLEVAIQGAGEAGQIYVVQADDTLWKLAEKYLGDGHRFPEIIEATNAKHEEDSSFALIEDPNRILVGSRLWIPTVASVATPVEAADKPPEPTSQPLAARQEPGGHIAFSFWNPHPARCTYEIDVIHVAACLANSQACQANRLIFPLNNVSEPAMSPAGDRLAFRGWGKPPSEDSPYADCAPPVDFRGLADTTLAATGLQRLTGYWEDSHPDWSPDGQQLLFDTDRNPEGITRILLVGADGSNERDLRIAGQHPSWAPDGQRFVYRGCDLTGNRCGLWLAYAAPVNPWEVGNNMIGPVVQDERAAHPDWSPVSDQVVYQSPMSGSWDLYVASAGGGSEAGPTQLTDDPAIEGLPSWSPDGKWIAFLSNSGGNWGIWIMRPDGSGRRLIFPFDGGNFTPRAVAPYGQRDWINEQISWSN